MKQQRDVLKTIRITKNTYEVIQSFPGSTWNDKINNLLEFYMSQDKEYKVHLADLEQQIKDKQQLLEDFKLKIEKFKDLFN